MPKRRDSIVQALGAALALTAALVAPAVAQAPQQAGDTFVLTGLVVDEYTGEPLAGVAVHLADSELGTLTGADGRYTLSGIPNHNGTVVARRSGYIPERRAVWVCTPVLHPGNRCSAPLATDHRLHFYMRPAPAPLRAMRFVPAHPDG